MNDQAFCPKCGKPRMEGAGFCPFCGQGYGQPIAQSTPPAAVAATSNTAATLAGVAWLLSAGLIGYLAYQQYQASQLLTSLGVSAGDLEGLALWNAIAGAITLYFGARVLTTPTRGLLGTSAAWAALSVLLGLLQVGSGGLSDIFVFAVIAQAAAGILSFVARQDAPEAAPKPIPAGARICTNCGKAIAAERLRLCNHCGEPIVSAEAEAIPVVSPVVDTPVAPVALTPVAAPAVYPIAARERTSPVLVLAVVLTGLLAIGLVGYAVLSNGGQGLIGGLLPAATPSPTPTPTPVRTLVPVAPTERPFFGTGVISFGKGYDPDTLAVTGGTTHFKASVTSIAWSAALTEAVNASEVTWVVATHSTSGVESIKVTQLAPISDPQADTLASKGDLAFLVDNKPGTYVMRYFRAGTVLAEGLFTLTK